MKDQIIDFVEGIKDDIGVEEWAVDACSLLEKLNLSVGVDLNGADMEAQVGSEPDEEVERGEFSGVEDEIPDLTDGTDSCSGDEGCVNFKGGMMDGRIVNYTDDVTFKIKQRCYWDDEEVVWRTMRDMVVCDQAEEVEVSYIDTSGEWKQEVELSGRKNVWSSTEDIENASREWKQVVELTGRKDIWSSTEDIENASGEWKQEVELTGREDVWSSTEDIENALTLEDVVSFERDVMMEEGNTDENSSKIEDSKSIGGSDDVRMVGDYDNTIRDMITVKERDSNKARDGCVVYGYKDGVMMKVAGEKDISEDYLYFGDKDGQITKKNGERILVNDGEKDLELVDIKDGGRDGKDTGAGNVDIGPN